jgi:hypothetical protein
LTYGSKVSLSVSQSNPSNHFIDRLTKFSVKGKWELSYGNKQGARLEMAQSSIDWNQVGDEVKTTVGNKLGGAWAIASRGALPQVQAMITVAQNIALSANDGKLTQSEYDGRKSMQAKALRGMLSSHKGVSVVVAEQAATAAWNALEIHGLAGVSGGLAGDIVIFPKGVVGGLAGNFSTPEKGRDRFRKLISCREMASWVRMARKHQSYLSTSRC